MTTNTTTTPEWERDPDEWVRNFAEQMVATIRDSGAVADYWRRFEDEVERKTREECLAEGYPPQLVEEVLAERRRDRR